MWNKLFLFADSRLIFWTIATGLKLKNTETLYLSETR